MSELACRGPCERWSLHKPWPSAAASQGDWTRGGPGLWYAHVALLTVPGNKVHNTDHRFLVGVPDLRHARHLCWHTPQRQPGLPAGLWV